MKLSNPLPDFSPFTWVMIFLMAVLHKQFGCCGCLIACSSKNKPVPVVAPQKPADPLELLSP
jgi:hypothetical protein